MDLYSTWDHKELDMTEHFHVHQHTFTLVHTHMCTLTYTHVPHTDTSLPLCAHVVRFNVREKRKMCQKGTYPWKKD